jgi:hypothetical protein
MDSIASQHGLRESDAHYSTPRLSLSQLCGPQASFTSLRLYLVQWLDAGDVGNVAGANHSLCKFLHIDGHLVLGHLRVDRPIKFAQAADVQKIHFPSLRSISICDDCPGTDIISLAFFTELTKGNCPSNACDVTIELERTSPPDAATLLSWIQSLRSTEMSRFVIEVDQDNPITGSSEQHEALFNEASRCLVSASFVSIPFSPGSFPPSSLSLDCAVKLRCALAASCVLFACCDGTSEKQTSRGAYEEFCGLCWSPNGELPYFVQDSGILDGMTNSLEQYALGDPRRWRLSHALQDSMALEVYRGQFATFGSLADMKWETLGQHEKSYFDDIAHSLRSSQATRPLSVRELRNGLRVARGPNWRHGDADGGEGNVGVLIYGGMPPSLTWYVAWPLGGELEYHRNTSRQEKMWSGGGRVRDDGPYTWWRSNLLTVGSDLGYRVGADPEDSGLFDLRLVEA